MTGARPMLDIIGAILLLIGTAFSLVAALGLLRLPDSFCRLHAITKADTLGLGLIVLGLILREPHWHSAGQMLLVWLLVMASGATACQVLARYQRQREDNDG